ncbi:MAG: NUDIX hydrolase [Bdellovibrionia bacterium]
MVKDPNLIADFNKQVGVATCVIQCGNDILLLRRSKTEVSAQSWCTPGGKLEGDESPLECIHREVFEETGFLPPAGAVSFVTSTFVRFGSWDYELFLFYLKVSKRPRITFNPDEHDAAEWVPLGELERRTLIQGQLEAIRMVLGFDLSCLSSI